MKLGQYAKGRNRKMKRLEVLKEELQQIKDMKTLSFELKRKAIVYFETEIEAIVNYGARNDDVDRT